MADRTAMWMRGLDDPRPLPAGMRDRLEGAMVASTLEPADENLLYILDRPKRLPAEMRARLTGLLTGEEHDADIVAAFDDLDAPRPLPTAMRARLIDRMMRRDTAAKLWQITGAAAAAVLVLVATVFFTTNRDERDPGNGRAIAPTPTYTATLPPTTTPPTFEGSPSPTIRPTTPASPRPSTTVLGTRETRRPRSTAPESRPEVQPTGGLAPSFDARTTARGPGRPATPTDLVGSVVGLVRNLLGALSLDVLSAGNPTGSVATPAATASAPEAAAPKASPAKARTRTPSKKPAATPVAAAPKPAAKPQPLLSLPVLREEPAIVVEVPVVELTLSL